MSQKIKGASEAAQAVMTDLQGRTGFELFWEGIDLETQREIQASLATVISDAVKAAQDKKDPGPTLEEFVARGYKPENYPPQGYEEVPSEGLTKFRAEQAEKKAAAEAKTKADAEAKSKATPDPKAHK